MYPQQSYVNTHIDQVISNNENWAELAESELEFAINFSNPNKASEPSEISFLIIQKAYQIISQLFFQLYQYLIKQDSHPVHWRKGIEAILKKSNKSDYSNSKAYRIITLLECMSKISEKIIANRLTYYASLNSTETKSMNLKPLLDHEQMRGRKFRSAVDAVMNLTHDVQHAFNQKKITSCLLLDVKGAFDHVSKDQLLHNLHKLNLSIALISWVTDFMTKRQISLVFDGNQQEMTDIECEIPQGSSISSILFLFFFFFFFYLLSLCNLRLWSYLH